MSAETYCVVSRSEDGKSVTALGPAVQKDPRIFALILCDALRHAARMTGVPEEALWEIVDRERANPTTTIEGGKLQ